MVHNELGEQVDQSLRYPALVHALLARLQQHGEERAIEVVDAWLIETAMAGEKKQY